MPLSPEEAQSVKTDLESGKAIGDIELLKPLGEVVIRTPQQEEKFKENYSKLVEEEKVGPRIKEIYSQIDKDVEEVTGVKKDPETKTYAHVKNLLTEFKGKADASDSTINELKSKISGEGVDVLRGEVDFWKKKHAEDTTAKDGQLEEMQVKHISQAKQRIIDVDYRKVATKFIDNLPGYFNSHAESVMSSIVQSSKLSADGKSIELVDKDGKVMRDAGYNVMTVEAYLLDQFKEVVKTGAGSGGAGGGTPPAGTPPATPPAGQKEWEKIEMPAEIKTQVALRDWIYSTHKEMDRKDINKAFNALCIKNKLPLQ